MVEDLIGLVNFGRPDAEPVGGPSALAISPDNRRVAFILQRADLATNSYCQALVVIDLSGRVAPRVLDRGGDYLMTTVVMRAMYIPNGFPRLNAPAWSPDGQSIAYLRRDHGRTELWRMRVTDGAPARVTNAPVDIDSWIWRGDSRSLVYASTPGRITVAAAIDDEGKSGWRYDARMAPNVGARPQLPAPLASVALAVDLATGTTSPATASEERELALGGNDPLDRRRVSRSRNVVWAETTGPSPVAPFQIRGADARNTPVACTSAACQGRILGLWWDPEGEHAIFLRSEGWNQRFSALYRWSPGQGQPRLLLRTDDALSGCRPAVHRLLCAREGAKQPPRLVSIDLAEGTETVMFDPNPAFGSLILGAVERLEWRTEQGREVYGDLVLPPGFRRDHALPTVLVQYSSRGFLRGGTGNEYPIHLLAARGFAVLSIQNPAMVGASYPDLKTFDEISIVNTKGWAERRNVNSAIQEGVRLLVAKGIADPSRLGITGLSEGASAARFALINSRTFAAAAISSCCVDEMSDVLAGPAWARYSQQIGYPPAYPVDSDFWRPYSLTLNARRMDTPLLMQLADSELLYGLPSFTALRANNQPVDLYTFADEFHIKWQPKHRRAVFDRALEWFSFWLQNRENPDPSRSAQFSAWRTLRETRDRAHQATSSIPAISSRP